MEVVYIGLIIVVILLLSYVFYYYYYGPGKAPTYLTVTNKPIMQHYNTATGPAISCLDELGGLGGTSLDVFTCTGGSNQAFNSDGKGGLYTTDGTNKWFLDAGPATVGTTISFSTAPTAGVWTYNSTNGGVSGTLSPAVNPNVCLEIATYNLVAGGNLPILTTCSNSPTQLFSLS